MNLSTSGRTSPLQTTVSLEASSSQSSTSETNSLVTFLCQEPVDSYFSNCQGGCGYSLNKKEWKQLKREAGGKICFLCKTGYTKLIPNQNLRAYLGIDDTKCPLQIMEEREEVKRKEEEKKREEQAKIDLFISTEIKKIRAALEEPNAANQRRKLSDEVYDLEELTRDPGLLAELHALNKEIIDLGINAPSQSTTSTSLSETILVDIIDSERLSETVTTEKKTSLISPEILNITGDKERLQNLKERHAKRKRESLVPKSRPTTAGKTISPQLLAALSQKEKKPEKRYPTTGGLSPKGSQINTPPAAKKPRTQYSSKSIEVPSSSSTPVFDNSDDPLLNIYPDSSQTNGSPNPAPAYARSLSKPAPAFARSLPKPAPASTSSLAKPAQASTSNLFGIPTKVNNPVALPLILIKKEPILGLFVGTDAKRDTPTFKSRLIGFISPLKLEENLKEILADGIRKAFVSINKKMLVKSDALEILDRINSDFSAWKAKYEEINQ